jgi:hypothetical protein
MMKIDLDDICAVISMICYTTFIISFSLLFTICFLAGIYLVVRMIFGC